MTAFIKRQHWSTISKAFALGVVGMYLCATSAIAAEISVLCSTALSEPMTALVPDFERLTGNKVAIMFQPTNIILDQVRSGKVADLIIVGSDAVADLEKQGKIVAGSRLDIASSSVGLAVLAGAQRPDISSADALKQTLLATKSVAISKFGLSANHFFRVVEKFGITNEMKPKLKLVEGAGRTADLVVKGEAEIAVQLITELMAVKGVEVVGPFPAGVESTIVLTSGIFVGAKEPDAAKALVTFLKAPATRLALKRTGAEPM